VTKGVDAGDGLHVAETDLAGGEEWIAGAGAVGEVLGLEAEGGDGVAGWGEFEGDGLAGVGVGYSAWRCAPS